MQKSRAFPAGVTDCRHGAASLAFVPEKLFRHTGTRKKEECKNPGRFRNVFPEEKAIFRDCVRLQLHFRLKAPVFS